MVGKSADARYPDYPTLSDAEDPGMVGGGGLGTGKDTKH